MSQQPNYSEIVTQAEKAVSSVKDPELKRAAFEKILEDLLANRASSGTMPPKVKHNREPVHVSRKTASKKRGGPQAYVEELADEAFFKKPKTIAQVKAELENRGHHIPLTSLSGPLQKLCQKRKLRRQKVKTKGNKETFNYSNW